MSINPSADAKYTLFSLILFMNMSFLVLRFSFSLFLNNFPDFLTSRFLIHITKIGAGQLGSHDVQVCDAHEYSRKHLVTYLFLLYIYISLFCSNLKQHLKDPPVNKGYSNHLKTLWISISVSVYLSVQKCCFAMFTWRIWFISGNIIKTQAQFFEHTHLTYMYSTLMHKKKSPLRKVSIQT